MGDYHQDESHDIFGDIPTGYSRPAAGSISGVAPAVMTTSSIDPYAPSAAAPAPPTRQSQSDVLSAAPAYSSVISIKIGEPEKHTEGIDPYVTYSVTTTTTLAGYASPTVSVRRRYQDFVWLRAQLAKEFEASVIPPMPEKNRLAYLDRFSDAFIQRRQNALQRFVDRIAAHPVLHKSDNLRLFLEAKSWGLETAKQMQKSTMMEDVGTAMINVFSKLKNPDERFMAVREYVQLLESNLNGLEKMYVRINKRQQDIATDYAELAASLTLASATEEALGSALRAIGQAHDRVGNAYKLLLERVDNEFLDPLHDYILYCHAILVTLKERDQRQLLHEELASDLEAKEASLAALTATADQNTAGKTSSVWGMFKQQDPDALRASIEEVKADLMNADQVQQAFSKLVMQELDLFNRSKTTTFRAIFTEYVRAHIDFFNTSKTTWTELLPLLQSLDFPAA